MQIHQLQPKHRNKSKKRVGRGGRKGTYSGRGMKGQKQRAGRKMEPLIRGLIKRYPKLKGYRSFRLDKNITIVNLEVLEKKMKDGDVVNPENLVKMGIVGKIKGKDIKIKILGNGNLTKKLVVENCSMSQSAKQAILKPGGTVK